MEILTFTIDLKNLNGVLGALTLTIMKKKYENDNNVNKNIREMFTYQIENIKNENRKEIVNKSKNNKDQDLINNYIILSIELKKDCTIPLNNHNFIKRIILELPYRSKRHKKIKKI